MKLLYTTTLLLFGIALTGQYNYGLEVEQQDAKIEGKLNIYDGNGNIFLGFNSGVGTTSGFDNCILGGSAGRQNTTGNYNSFFGAFSGFTNNTGNDNSFFGRFSGHRNTSGSNNSFLGANAGHNNSTGSNNVVIGYGAGPTANNSNNSNKLYIDVQSFFNQLGNDNPLIYGEFDNDLIKINGTFDVTGTMSVADTTSLTTLHITETAKLEPQATVPTCGANDLGLLYVNAMDSTLYLCKGSLGWKEVMVTP